MSEFVQSEISYQSVKEFLWTDSRVVLWYIKNESRRFYTFVADRMQHMHSVRDTDSWFYVESNESLADVASRGIAAKELSHSSSLNCPAFLNEDSLFVVNKDATYNIAEGDIEVRQGTVLNQQSSDHEIFFNQVI